MLGAVIEDPGGVESNVRAAEGLGLLPLRARFGHPKRTAQVRARATGSSWLSSDGEVVGYEIHMGRVERTGGARGAFTIHQRSGEAADDTDGAVSASGVVAGTMIHGLFDDAGVRRTLLRALREEKGLPGETSGAPPIEGDEYDRLADVLRANMQMGSAARDRRRLTRARSTSRAPALSLLSDVITGRKLEVRRGRSSWLPTRGAGARRRTP